MAFNGSGTYSAPASSWNPAVDGTDINSTDWAALLADLSTALSLCVTKDGQQTVTANIPMSGFKITGIGAATARTDAASLATIQDGTGTYATAGGTANALTLTLTPAITAYVAGQSYRFIASASANTSAATLAINGLTAKAIQSKGSALVGGEIPANAAIQVVYDGAAFQLFSAAYAATAGNIPTTDNAIQDFRLTLTSGVPVTTSDVTGATTLYATPYKGNRIALYDGSSTWNIRTSAEFSLGSPTLTSGKPYDVFCYDNSGTPTLEVLVWTNDTTRATALTTQDGVLVKTGATTRRYLGTIYSSGANTMEDSLAKRYVFNYNNRVDRPMQAALETTDSWNYTTATWRQANANAANQLDYVVGVSEDPIRADVVAIVGNTNAGVYPLLVGVGVDSTSANSTSMMGATMNQIVNGRIVTNAAYRGYPGVGRHTLVWLEYSAASGTTTWYGDGGTPTLSQSGITGTVKQ